MSIIKPKFKNMNTKHTQGEWVINHKNAIQSEPESPERTITICQVYGNDEESRANAKLIAISPIMYDYIKEKADTGCEKAKKILSTLH